VRHPLGMVIGRFQHLHIGHVEMIEKGLAVCEQLIIMVGSSQESFTLRNPFDINKRIDLIKQAFEEEIVRGDLYVVPIPDLTDENDHSKEWGDYVLEQVSYWRTQYAIKNRLSCMIYGNDEEREDWYREEDAKDIAQIVLKREDIPISATKMREFLVQNNKSAWLEYMPKNRLNQKESKQWFHLFRKDLIANTEYSNILCNN